jgi:O-antigen/teichoic acid export membrane protein
MPARFAGSALMKIWHFAAGMMAITFLALLLTQADKILLARLLTLESFGYYALAAVAASGLYMLTGPITGAFYPHFTVLATRGDEVALRALYHLGAQLVTVLMGSAAMVLIVFGDRVLRLWTGNPALSQHVAPLMAVLALGTLFNGLMWIPSQMQYAHGWTSLTIKVNIVAVCLLLPALFWIIPAYGAIGAARVWVTLNTGYLIFAIPLMHRRLLRAEKWRWYREDVAIPLAAATSAAFLCRWVMPHHLSKLGEFGVLLMTASCVLAAAALAAPLVRDQLTLHLPGRIGSFNPRTV